MLMQKYSRVQLHTTNSEHRGYTVVPSQSHSTQWIDCNTNIKKISFLFVLKNQFVFIQNQRDCLAKNSRKLI